MKQFNEKLEAFRALVEMQRRAHYEAEYPKAYKDGVFGDDNWATTIKAGKKYTKVDVGHSGKLMVVNETGEIFGCKGYGVIHRGHAYGTLESTRYWNWGGYHPTRWAV